MCSLKKTVFFDNVLYMLKNWYKWDKSSVVYSVFRIPALIALPSVTALVPKLLIDAIESEKSSSYILLIVALLSVLLAMLSWIDPFLKEKINASATNMLTKYRLLAFEKLLHMDYDNIESYNGRNLYERSQVFAGMGSRGVSAKTLPQMVVQLFANMLGIFTYSVLLLKLNPALVIIVLVTCIFEYLLVRWMERTKIEHRNKESGVYMHFWYISRMAIDSKSGKDIRLYNAERWLISIIAKISKQYADLMDILLHQTLQFSVLESLLLMFRELVAYIFLIVAVLSGKITISDFVFLFGIVTGFSAWISGLLSQLLMVNSLCEECQRFRDFLNMPDHIIKSNKFVDLDFDFENIDEISFCDVSFTYEGSDTPALSNLNFTIKKGQKIALVGPNGSGKTTIIKLLCGLYDPDEGEILINGKNVNTFSKEARFKLFSVVFQDYRFLPMSISENITLCQEGEEDNQKLVEVLKKANIFEKISQLPKGTHTKMLKRVWKDAEEFSGGQIQRLLLAKALYKDAPILILDEPTAALDPIAESNIYKDYDRLMQGKISFFISHRLISTQFCDRIFYIYNGEIVEEGSHDDLIKQKGNYWGMFQTQSYYYRQGENEI